MQTKVIGTTMNRIHNQQGFPVDFIGKGECGGKAHGLLDIQKVFLEYHLQDKIADIRITIPNMTVIRTDVFEQFMEMNNLWEIALGSRDDVYIAHIFQKASLPPIIVGDLRSLIAAAHEPLAVRSSSLLEDSSAEPFAGVYATKMLANNQQSLETRFSKLTEAIKFVYSSLFFSDSRDYFRIINKDVRQERMALIIQEVVGNCYGDYFYPLISGVGRSYNHYPTQRARREDGVVNLALGLGKTIVDGGWSWMYCPAYPKSPPPFSSIREQLNCSQTGFWAIKMGQIPEFNPISEVEFMEKRSLESAEKDGTLREVCSTYDYQNDVIRAGIQYEGPRLVNFAPVLQYNSIALNEAVNELLSICRKHYGSEVEIEFALDKENESYRLGFLQVRGMQVRQKYNKTDFSGKREQTLLAESSLVLGDGECDDICDIIMVKREGYDAVHNQQIAVEISELNSMLVSQKKPYLLLGFGRWGSSDPWLGIPVSWSQISGAQAIIEATLPEMKPDLSQGSHFFHNLIAFNVFYLSIAEEKKKSIDWNWLNQQKIENEREFVSHLSLATPLQIIVCSSSNQGVIFK
ncbi:MAG: PEP/pyruvate-binding domain-containing protein [Candidatus Cloacimonetes bacterium]|nr:PEP/pyruvate-binding domain-containing protein [Candidatus Cloacimonadota bacterium]